MTAPESSRANHAASRRKRSFLFLQGPLSRFFEELGRALIARGHHVHRVNLHLGEQLFWRLPASNFRGRFDEWRSYIAGILDTHRITDIILVGDRRPYHVIAAEEARARGIAVLCTDFGYLRPGWITLEYDGMSTYSRFPRDPEAIRALAARLPEPDLQPRFNSRFGLVAALDVGFTVPQVLGRPLYPHYRWHGIFHPFAEYAGWLAALARRRARARATQAAKARLEQDRGSYFLFPLQLATDFQIRAHSPFADVRDAVRDTIASFAASGSDRKLVFVVHPLDNGLINWGRQVRRLTRGTRAEAQISVLEDGIPPGLLRNAAGIVTINSTVGITALYHDIPVKVLGNAVFDVPGLTHQGRLDRFWHEAAPPDPELRRLFLRALAGTTQLRGGFHERDAKAHGIAEIVQRLEQGLYPLPALSDEELAQRPVRPAARTIVVIGAAGGIGLAVARDYAAPGVRLCLVTGTHGALAAAAGDCLRRGAQVDTVVLDLDDDEAVAEHLEAIDRHTPIDQVVACTGDAALLAALTAPGGLADRMRRRERGGIALVSALAGRAEWSSRPDHSASQGGLLAYAGSLPRRRDDPITVSIARAGRLAGRLAAGGADARLVAINPDRAAEYIRRGIERGARVIAFPGPLFVGLRALRWLQEWPPRAIRESAADSVAEDGPIPAPGDTSQGD
ncbi:MAG TPA: SDR family NAD(P)-dependent oxidoreductase [Stellaceae bacterium]|nr:SDR family NAD(P)-dependent oxidoreductase [Stellaceae bacterium]